MTTQTKRTVAITVLVAVALWFVPSLQGPLGFPIFYLLFMFNIFFWVGQASSWNLFTGNSGYFSFGQGAWYGVGVYSVGVLAGKQGWPLLPTFLVGAILGGALGLLIGLIVFRLRKIRGEIFALMTLAVAFVMAAIANITPAIDGGPGIPLSGRLDVPTFLGPHPSMVFRLALIVAVIAVVAAQIIQGSRLGWGLFSIRDDEGVAEALGVPTFRFKMIALGVSTFIAGLGGAIHSLQISYITIGEVFNIRVPLFVILMSIIGGTRHWMGPIVGATVVYTFTDRLRNFHVPGAEWFSDLLSERFLLGALLIVIVVLVKGGLYFRMRGRPWHTLVGAVAGIALWFAMGSSGSLVTTFAFALAGAVASAFLPQGIGARRSRDPGDEPPEPDLVAVGGAQRG